MESGTSEICYFFLTKTWQFQCLSSSKYYEAFKRMHSILFESNKEMKCLRHLQIKIKIFYVCFEVDHKNK